MLSLERIPDQVGYLVLNDDGAVVASGGELENDEHMANIITGLVTITDKIDTVAFPPEESFKKISVNFESYSYVVCLSNKKIHVVKRRIMQEDINENQEVS